MAKINQFCHFVGSKKETSGARIKIWSLSWSLRGKSRRCWEFCPWECVYGGIFFSQKSEKWQNVNFLVKTKNVYKGLKCPNFFWTRGSQKGGGQPLGKKSQIIPSFFLNSPNVYLTPSAGTEGVGWDSLKTFLCSTFQKIRKAQFQINLNFTSGEEFYF